MFYPVGYVPKPVDYVPKPAVAGHYLPIKSFHETHRDPVHDYRIDGITFRTSEINKSIAEELVENLSKIPTGRKALEEIKKHNTRIELNCPDGTAYHPDGNLITLGRNKQGCLEYDTVFMAHYLKQNHTELRKIKNQNLDCASEIMIKRASRADATVQALKACKEWEAIEHYGPMDSFCDSYEKCVKAYDEKNSLSDAFKAAYLDKESNRWMEENMMRDRQLNKMISSTEPDTARLVSVKPADIAKYCGGRYVKDFNEFADSKEARQVELLTKTILELYDVANVVKGGTHDASLETMPASRFSSYYNKRYAEAAFDPSLNHHDDIPRNVKRERKATKRIVFAAVKAVDKIDRDAHDGKASPRAEKILELSKKKMAQHFSAEKKKSILSLLAFRKSNDR